MEGTDENQPKDPSDDKEKGRRNGSSARDGGCDGCAGVPCSTDVSGGSSTKEEVSAKAAAEAKEKKEHLLNGALSASRDGGGQNRSKGGNSGKSSGREKRGGGGGGHRGRHHHNKNRANHHNNNSSHDRHPQDRRHHRSRSRSVSPSPPREREHFRRSHHRHRADDYYPPEHHRRARSLSPPLDGHKHAQSGDPRSRGPPYRDHHPNNHQQQQQQQQSSSSLPPYRIVDQPPDPLLGPLRDDPRNPDPTLRLTIKATKRGTGRNTESFDPASTLVRPDLRILVGSNSITTYNRPLKHDDVVIVPELFGQESDWTLYYKLVEEMRELQKLEKKGAEWIPWHEGAHLISKNPSGSKTFEKIVDRLCEYFKIQKKSIGTRFNWYKDSSDWKPFHHDSAAFNPQRAKTQNITVGVSFGATRELAFIRAKPYEDGNKCKLYFPQTNNGVFSFGRDANILWKHGVNALPPEQQDGKGRISIILWGLAGGVIEEDGSPPLLGSDGRGLHASRDHRDRRRDGRGGGRGGGGGGRTNGGRDNRHSRKS